MRWIKFRAWDKLTERMVKVNRINFDDKEIEVVIKKTHATEDYETISFYEIGLMQYIGLKDKNGVEIYEGDVLQMCEEYGGSSYYPIVVEYGYVGFQCYQPNNPSNKIPFRNLSIEYYNVVGNIYENPELIA